MYAQYLLYGLIGASTLTIASPINNTLQSRTSFEITDSAGQPQTLNRRTLYNVDDISSDAHKTQLKEGQKEAVDIAATALRKMDDPKYTKMLTAWFGSGDSVHDDVKKVLDTFVGDSNKDGTGADILGDVSVLTEDYWEIDGTKFCDVNKNGKTGTAYYKPKDKKPAMHYCNKFFERKGKDAFLGSGDDKCKSISGQIDTTTTTRQYRGANVLHEYMHYVGKKALGKNIVDKKYGAYSCYTYKSEDNADTVHNADTYVFYAMHIWLTENCGKDFSYPRSEEDD